MKYFGTDGVRGIANQELSPELAFKLGRCGGFVLTKHASDTKPPKVLVARDTRISGQMLEQALIAGLLSVGIEVFSLGVITTPGVAYLVRVQDADAGIMISASHNPVQITVLNSLVGMVISYLMKRKKKLSSCLNLELIICHAPLQKVLEL